MTDGITSVENCGTAQRRALGTVHWMVWLLVLLIGVCLIAIAWHIANAPRPVPPASSADINQFYRTELSPLLDATLQRNRQAADRALATLHKRFDAHRAGVKPFAEDVTGWGTRFGVIYRYSGDLWDRYGRGNTNAHQVGDYISGKFRYHVLSEQSLQADMDDVLKQFKADLEANRNQLFAEMQLPLRGSRAPVVLDENGWTRLCADVSQRAQKLTANTPRDSVVTGIAGFVGGNIASYAVEEIVASVLTRVGTQIAVSAGEATATAGGGAMVGGTATGGSVGSFGGPAGTVIGVGVGLVVGAGVDWWMTDHLKGQLTDQGNKFLDTVEHQIIDGNEKAPGLRASFEQAVKLADQCQREAIIDCLLKVPK